jgi:hypothetical protein
MKKLYRVLKAYGPWPVGHIFTEMPGNVGRTLISRHLIEEVIEETKAVSAPANRMMKVPVNRSAHQAR